MRITFLSAMPNMTGGQRVVAIYAQWLQQQGHDIKIVAAKIGANETLMERTKGKVKSLLGPAKEANSKKRDSFLYHLDGVELNVVPGHYGIRAQDVPRSDVLVATWWETAEWLMALPDDLGVKTYFIQNHEVYPWLPADRVKATYLSDLKKITISKWLVALMRDEYGDADVAHVPNSVDHAAFHASARGKQQRPTIGVLYSERWIKGWEVSMAAIAELRKKWTDLRVITFGVDKPPQALPACFEFFKLPTQEKIRSIYSECDLWLCGSRQEGFHLPPMEAMACRTPVVSTKVGGPIDVIEDGANGFLVDIGDSDGLAKAADSVLSMSEEDWVALSDRALATVTSYTWDEAAQQFHDALEEIVTAGQGRANEPLHTGSTT